MNDWIQWYAVAGQVMYLAALMCLHGRPREGFHDFRWAPFHLALVTPTFGRVMGWW